ncbi:CLUMA_CG002424, isoform A [Clunio marinus]|uniref:CLUMA_CG002424, isoform A n=1 Tax=Clunio marinus TaxID=568069 RepID=A0A1J1HL32_9DIPT|nr:CLUMA_CG002424, isoform A [Clunio marinus]
MEYNSLLLANYAVDTSVEMRIREPNEKSPQEPIKLVIADHDEEIKLTRKCRKFKFSLEISRCFYEDCNCALHGKLLQ